MKKVLQKLEQNGAPADTINEFKTGAPNAVKKILGNYDNYDVMMGSSMDGDAMYVFPWSPLAMLTSAGTFSSTSARTASPPSPLSGSTVSRR